MKRWIFLILLCPLLVIPARASYIRWVDFSVPYESMQYALEQDIATFEQEKHVDWIQALALAACRTGGKCQLESVKKAVADLKKDKSPEEIVGENPKFYNYYYEAYSAVLGGMVGSFVRQVWMVSALAMVDVLFAIPVSRQRASLVRSLRRRSAVCQLIASMWESLQRSANYPLPGPMTKCICLA